MYLIKVPIYIHEGIVFHSEEINSTKLSIKVSSVMDGCFLKEIHILYMYMVYNAQNMIQVYLNKKKKPRILFNSNIQGNKLIKEDKNVMVSCNKYMQNQRCTKKIPRYCQVSGTIIAMQLSLAQKYISNCIYANIKLYILFNTFDKNQFIKFNKYTSYFINFILKLT